MSELVQEITFHSGASDTVSATAAALTNDSGVTVYHSKNQDQLTLNLNYTKGTEDGVRLYVVFLRTVDGTAEYQESTITYAAGVGTVYPKYYEFTATGLYSIDVPLNGKGYFKLYQIRSGVAAVSGTFTLYGRTAYAQK